jgi:hypothetical protein
LPEDLGCRRNDLDRKGQELGRERPRLFFADTADGDAIDLRKVHLMKEQLVILPVGLGEKILDGLSAWFVLKSGDEGEGIEQISSLHLGDSFVAPVRGPWSEKDDLSRFRGGP